MIVVAVLASAGEFQHRTIRASLLAAPRRGRLLLAKWGAAATYGALVTGLGVWAVVAAGIGMLTRSTAVTIAVSLLWKFVVEGLLPVRLRRPGISAWTPAGAADSLTGLQGHALSVAVGGGLLLAYTVVVGTVAAASLLSRDSG